jgi:uncharacterized metal-binding protein YceD (DUF177 family)
VKLKDEYEIPVFGLKEGIHTYSYEISTGFFEYFNNPDLPGGDLKLSLTLNKMPQFIELDFYFSGTLKLICDRCLEDYDFEVVLTEKLFIRFGESFEELDDNVIIIPRDESRINIAQYIYEFVALSIPYKKVHSDKSNGSSGCNPEMIKRLDELKVKDNIQKNTRTDPRWDKLKNIN